MDMTKIPTNNMSVEIDRRKAPGSPRSTGESDFKMNNLNTRYAMLRHLADSR